MEYNKITFTWTGQNADNPMIAELIIDMAAEAGCEAFEELANNKGVVAFAQKDLLDEVCLEEGIQNFFFEDITIAYSIEEAENKNWNEVWEEQGFEPIYINNQCVIYDAKHTDKESLICDIPLKVGIETQQAFGTGTHETTQMIVEQLLSINWGEKKILDCGCGTGILGIIAAMSGAQEVMAYDIDEWSTKNTLHNAQLNLVSNIEVKQGDAAVLEKIDTTFDVVVANINRNILLTDMPAFRRKMSPNSVLILSGFYAEDIELLLEKAHTLGLKEQHRTVLNNWACLVLA